MTIIDQTLGVSLTGILIAGVLFGLFTSQVYYFHQNFPRESPWVKFGLVRTLFQTTWLANTDCIRFIELAHTICIFHIAYVLTISHFQALEVLVTVPPSFPATVLFHAIVAVLAQGYFTYRIARLTGPPYIIPWVCGILMLYQLGFDIITQYFMHFSWLVPIPLVLRAVVDAVISATLVYNLLVQRKKSSYKSTIAVIDKLVLWSIETGIITSVIGIALLICFFVDNETNYAWVALLIIFPKADIQICSMNSRVRLREMQATEEVSLAVSKTHRHNSTLETLRFATKTSEMSSHAPEVLELSGMA
ncbi:hypothetical protein BDP27DRAFT_1332725 [Rhodocollybia butyracea]|uniref:DUF6534 domain-containing protein n=1 Tax=Rhodocollybia butyracea TaxID=206335 RepID=A0A9P5PG08_9AGAR|nr:hypothetical protein BDP27DRAFT_1332725 [Rhodocollybia butyracea]